MTSPSELAITGKELPHTIRRIAFQILERYPEQPLAFVGIHTRGVLLADRVHALLAEHRSDIQQGSIDIALYRDDLDNLGTIPNIRGSDLPFTIDGAAIILFDDVLYTGRTIRAAINVICDYGRPSRIELAVLVDRGHRELPIAPDYTGLVLATEKSDHVRVHFTEIDGKDGVYHRGSNEGES